MAEETKKTGKELFKSIAEIVMFSISIIGATTAYLKWRKDKLDDRLKEIDAVYEQASAPGGAMDIFTKYGGAGPELKGYYLGDGQFKDAQTGNEIGKYLAFLSRICYKRELGLFDEEDFAMFAHEVDDLLALPFAQRLFSDIVRLRPRMKRSTFPYMPLLRRGMDEGIWGGYAKLLDELDRREGAK